MTRKKDYKVNHLTLYAEKFDGDVSKDREKYIGGSDVGTILGVNQFKSPYELYLEKTGQIEKENLDDKLQIKLGHKMEQVVAELYEEETGKKTQMANKSFTCKEYPFLRGHIDRKILKEKRGLEIKTTSSYNKTNYKDGEIPPTHYYQCMFYMMITGMHKWDICTLRDNRQLYITTVEWDSDIAEDMLDKLIEFWNCVETKTWDKEIDGSEHTTQAINNLYPVSLENSVVALSSDDTITSISDYYAAKENIKALETIVNSFENQVKGLMKDNEVALINNEYKVTWKSSSRSGGYDVKRYLEDHPKSELLKYKKPDTTTRRFAIKEIKQKEIEHNE